jgi:hypothetical protein
MSEEKTMTEQVTHEQIYDRLCAVEAKVDQLDKNTQAVVAAFNAASGAFVVLEWIARAVKPILVIGAFCGAIWIALENKLHH